MPPSAATPRVMSCATIAPARSMLCGPAVVAAGGTNSVPKNAESAGALDHVVFAPEATPPSTQFDVTRSHWPGPSCPSGGSPALLSQIRSLARTADPAHISAATAAETHATRVRNFLFSP